MLPIIITGKVVKGDQYGRKIGFPTANLKHATFDFLPKNFLEGIYAGYVTLPNEQRYQAGIIVHTRSSQKYPTIEAHVINFSKDIYGKNITLEVCEYIRPYQTFSHESELIQQITGDLEKIKEVLE